MESSRNMSKKSELKMSILSDAEKEVKDMRKLVITLSSTIIARYLVRNHDKIKLRRKRYRTK